MRPSTGSASALTTRSRSGASREQRDQRLRWPAGPGAWQEAHRRAAHALVRISAPRAASAARLAARRNSATAESATSRVAGSSRAARPRAAPAARPAAWRTPRPSSAARRTSASAERGRRAAPHGARRVCRWASASTTATRTWPAASSASATMASAAASSSELPERLARVVAHPRVARRAGRPAAREVDAGVACPLAQRAHRRARACARIVARRRQQRVDRARIVDEGQAVDGRVAQPLVRVRACASSSASQPRG